MSQCGECGESSVQQIDSGEVVCISCGTVEDDIVLRHEKSDSNLSCQKKVYVKYEPGAKPHKLSRRQKPYPSPGERECQKLIRDLAADFKMCKTIQVQVSSQFSKIFKKYAYKRLEFKRLIAASCVFAFLKSTNATFTITDFCNHVGAPSHKLLSTYTKIKDQLTVPETSTTKEESVRALLKNLPRSTQDERENFCTLIKKTLKILEFSDKNWLVTGRSLEAMMIACAYVAWREMNHFEQKNSFCEFCRLCNVMGKWKTANARVAELKKMFLTLGKKLSLPDLDEKNVYENITSIISRHDSMDSEDEPSKDETKTFDENEMQHFKEFRRPWQQNVNCKIEEPVINCDVTDDELIKEDEWGEYIRNEQEVACVKELHEKYGI